MASVPNFSAAEATNKMSTYRVVISRRRTGILSLIDGRFDFAEKNARRTIESHIILISETSRVVGTDDREP